MKKRLMVIVGVLVLMVVLPQEVQSADSDSISLTITLNVSPQVSAISPSYGSSSLMQPVTFTTTFTDDNGWQNIQYVNLIINTEAVGNNCFYGYYNQNTNKLYIRNDANTAWLGGFSPGDYMTIENSYAKLDCSMTTVSGSGDTLTVRWNVTFLPTFTGAKNAYLYVRDDANLYQGWLQKGTWTINQTPQVGIITPSAGTSDVNQAATITTTYSSLGGWQGIDYVYLIIMDKLEINRLYLCYMQNTNQLYLLHIRNNDTTASWLGGFAPGSSETIDTPHVTLDCLKTDVSGSGDVMTVNWNITFKSGFAGTNNDTYLFVADDAGGYSSIVKKGTWYVTINSAP